MTYLILILISIVLFVGFISLTAFETSHGTRVFAKARSRFDTHAARVFFIVSHVDWSAFVGHAVRTLMEHLAHEIAHASLQAVRFLERLLTRAVRALRTRRVERLPDAPLVPARGVAERLRSAALYLRKTLRSSRRRPASTKSEEV